MFDMENNRLVRMINEELTEMVRKGKDLYWTGKNPKGKWETGKQAFGRERDMNPETYELRRQVMGYIYEAKNLLKKTLNYDLPRQRIRIIDIDPKVFIANEGRYEPSSMLGCATYGGNDIYIPARTITEGFNVKKTTYHEILHSAFCVGHDNNSLLMSGVWNPAGQKLSSEELDRLFIEHVKKALNLEKH
jgi:hypothetical protein